MIPYFVKHYVIIKLVLVFNIIIILYLIILSNLLFQNPKHNKFNKKIEYINKN